MEESGVYNESGVMWCDSSKHSVRWGVYIYNEYSVWSERAIRREKKRKDKNHDGGFF